MLGHFRVFDFITGLELVLGVSDEVETSSSLSLNLPPIKNLSIFTKCVRK